MTILRTAAVLLVLLLGLTSGCNILGPIAYYLSPPQIQKPEFEFPTGSTAALLIEARNSQYDNPVFNAALYERLELMLREGESEATLLPLRAATDLRRKHADFAKWSLQKIGRELDTEYVLYLKIDRLVIQPSRDHPLLTPEIDLRMKLIGVNEASVHARIWPEEKAGRLVTCKRQYSEAGDTNPDAYDAETRKLGCDTAYWVSMPFIEVDLEEKPPVER